MIISDAQIEELKWMAEAGLTPAEMEGLTRIPAKEIRALKKKHGWKASAPSVAVREAELMDMTQAEADAITTKAENNGLKAAGAEYASKLFGTLSAKMLALKKLPPIKSWKDVKIIDDILRRAAGLDDGNNGGGGKVLINLGVIAGGRMPVAPAAAAAPREVTLEQPENETPTQPTPESNEHVEP